MFACTLRDCVIAGATCMNANSCAVQAITDMVIANESRVAKSRVVTTFNRARQVLINIAIR